MSQSLPSQVKRLFEQAQSPSPLAVPRELVDSLPVLVRRYLEAAHVIGKKLPRTVHLRQFGSFRTSPRQKWFPMEAEQWYSTAPPGFVWLGTIRPAPLVKITAADAFVNGRGSLEVRAQSLIPMGKFSGLETDSGELLRFLLEVSYFPQYWISPLISWQAADEQSAKVSIQVGEVRVSARVFFANDGLPTHALAERHRQAGKSFELTPWIGRLQDFRFVDGVLVPYQTSAAWELPKGEFEYFRATIMELDYFY